MEKTVSRSVLIISSLLLVLQSAMAQYCTNVRCNIAAEYLENSMNTSVDPCNNFYQFACGNWSTNHLNKNNLPQTTLGLRRDENDREILAFLKQDNTVCEPEAIHKARQFYFQCLENSTTPYSTLAYNTSILRVFNVMRYLGVDRLPFINLSQTFNVEKTLAKAHRFGINVYFDFGVAHHNGKYTLRLKRPAPKMDVSIRRSHVSKRDISEDHRYKFEYISNLVQTACYGLSYFACRTTDAFYGRLINLIEERIDKFSKFMKTSALLKKEPKLIQINELQMLSDKIANEMQPTFQKLNWMEYIKEMFDGLNTPRIFPHDDILCEDLNYVKNALRFIYSNTTDKLIIEQQIWWEVVNTIIPYFDRNLADIKANITEFEEYDQTRAERCAKITTETFGTAISYGYKRKGKYIKAKTKAAEMLESIRKSYEQIIRNVSWIAEDVKAVAISKMQSLKSRIAYASIIDKPSDLNDLYRDMEIKDDFFDTMMLYVRRKVENTLSKYDQKFNPNEENWAVPNDINGFYDPHINTITIQFGLLGKPIFEGEGLRALNYGALGSILAHTLTHAYDKLGQMYDQNGKHEFLKKPYTTTSFVENAKCFEKAYTNYSVTVEGQIFQVNSTAAPDEDLNYNTAFKIALLAYKSSVSKLGKEPLLPFEYFQNVTHEQLFTLAYANVFCENPTKYSQILDEQYDHSSNEVRVNRIIQNLDEFSEIWNCPKGSTMNPSNKCSVW